MAMVRAGGDFGTGVRDIPGQIFTQCLFTPTDSSDIWGWHHLCLHPPAQLWYLPCSPKGTCLHEACHCLPGPLHSHILHLQILAGWEMSEPASRHPAPASPILLAGAGLDKLVVPMLCISRMNFSQQNYAGLLWA